MTSVNRVEKPWGYEIHWAHTAQYVGKILHIRAGQALSLSTTTGRMKRSTSSGDACGLKAA